MTRAAIYARVSSAAQRDRHTIENQLRALPAYAAQQGWTVTGTYVDDGRSAKAGKLDARDGFARLVADAELGAYDVLLVVDIDRLTRTDSLEERARILGPFQRRGIQIVTPSGGALDLRTFLGELYVTMQALVAAEENRKRAERIRAGKLRAIAEGRKPAGPTPYGLAYDRATGVWSLDPARAPIVREIFGRVVAGESCIAIADDLHARGAPEPRGQWSRHKAWQIVRASYPRGVWVADKARRLTIVVPPIVDDSTWYAAEAALVEHGRRGLRRTRHVYLLEGLATCGACGCPIAIRSATPDGRRPRVNPAAYVCRARKGVRRGDPTCSAPILPVADVDARVWAAVIDELSSADFADAVARRRAEQAADRRDWEADAAGHRAHLARLDRVEAGVLARHRRGTVSGGALDLELVAIGRERAAVRAQLATAERAARAAPARAGDLEGYLAELRGLAASAAPEERQRLVRALLAPRGARFVGERVHLTLAVAAAPAAPRAGSLAVVPDCRTRREGVGEIITIRRVA